MSTVFIFCRTWVGFTDEFPFVDELNCLPQNDISGDVEHRIISWFRENRGVVKKQLREKVKARVDAIKKHKKMATARPNPTVPYESSDFTNIILPDSVSAEELAEERRMQRLFMRISADYEKRRRTQKKKTTIAARIRGNRTDSLGVRVARVMDWTRIAGSRFGDLSPSRMMFLAHRDAATAKTAIEVLDERFGGSHKYGLLGLKFGMLPECEFSRTRRVIMVRRLEDAVRMQSEWEPDSNLELYRIIVGETQRVLEAIRDDSKRTDSAASRTDASATAVSARAEPNDGRQSVGDEENAEQFVFRLGKHSCDIQFGREIATDLPASLGAKYYHSLMGRYVNNRGKIRALDLAIGVNPKAENEKAAQARQACIEAGEVLSTVFDCPHQDDVLDLEKLIKLVEKEWARSSSETAADSDEFRETDDPDKAAQNKEKLNRLNSVKRILLDGKVGIETAKSVKSAKKAMDTWLQDRVFLKAPALARHLDVSVAWNGMLVEYKPEKPISWSLE